MARAKKQYTGEINKIVALALTDKQLLDENIIRLVSMLSNEEQFAAAEILNGVDEVPEQLPSPKDTIKIWGNWCKIIKWSWNPLRKKVVVEYSCYETVVINHSFVESEDILLLKEKFFTCTHKEQAKNIVSEGPHSMKVIINKLEVRTQTDDYGLRSWAQDICDGKDWFETK